MRILQGKKVVEAPGGWREGIDADGRAVIIDLGAGDGRYAYECARGDPDSLYIAVDPDPQTMADYAFRASRKPARGGVENVVFVVAAVEALQPELKGIAKKVRVNFPWGSLMRGLLEPQPSVLRAVASLLHGPGVIEVVLSYHPEHDTNAFAGEPLSPAGRRLHRIDTCPRLRGRGLCYHAAPAPDAGRSPGAAIDVGEAAAACAAARRLLPVDRARAPRGVMS